MDNCQIVCVDTKKWQLSKIVRLVGLFMSNHYLQDLVISYFVDRLINSGKIKVVKYGERFF